MDEIDKQKFDALVTEAHELGIQYTGRSIEELEGHLAMARAERGRDHQVACYGLSFDPTDRRCRICQLRNPCADLDKSPRVGVLEVKLQPIPCEVCGKGMLEVECVEPYTREVRDYACTTKGCQNTVSVQCGWETVGADSVVVIAEPEEAKPEDPESTDDEVVEPEPEKPKPDLRVVQGGASKSTKKVVEKKATKKAAAKKVVKKTVAKKTASKKKVTKKAAKKVVVRKQSKSAPSKDGLTYRYDGTDYTSLSQVIVAITGARNYSSGRFWKGADLKSLKPGDTLEREWQGETTTVEVIG